MSGIKNENDVKKKLKVKDWKEITKKKFTELIKMSPKIDKDVMLKILDQIPHYVKIAADVVGAMASVASQNEKIASQTISAINNISECLSELAKKKNISPEEKRYMVDKMIRVAEILKEIDKNNKIFILKVLLIIGTFSAYIIHILSGLAGNKGPVNEES